MQVPGDARRALLTGAFDDAGLFPPASLSVADAFAAHLSARTGPYSWMVNRFVVDAGRLPSMLGHIGDQSLRLSVLVSEEMQLPALGNATIEQLEIRAPDGDVAGAARVARVFADDPDSQSIFVEIPAGDVECVGEIADLDGVGAKIRCGGSTAAMFPSPAEIATTIVACRDWGVRLKATAGLHHPLRAPDPDGFTHHGFLNLLAAIALAHAREFDESELRKVLADENPESFSLNEDALSWRSEKVFAGECAAAREELFAGVGSCSFDEPVADLEALGILPL